MVVAVEETMEEEAMAGDKNIINTLGQDQLMY